LITRFTVLGGDDRQNHLFRKLLSAGFEAECWQVPGLADTKASLYEALCRTQAAVLPMPALRGSEFIRAGSSAGIPLRSVLDSLPRGAYVLGGGLSAAAELLRQYPVHVIDYGASEPLATQNAVPTAEGAIRIAMEKLPVTIQGSRFLVIGFGRIGKVLSQRLAALGGLVTVAARKPGDCALAESFGCQSDRTGLYLRGLARYDCIFNTVPAPVLAADDFAAMRPDCLVVDLASGQGGAGEGAVPADGPVYLRAPGLPGKAAPATAAEFIKNAILEALTAP